MAGKVHTTFVGPNGTRGKDRFYADDDTGITLPGVTSVLNMFPKPFLQPWAAKMTAERAVDSVSFISSMEREGAVNYLKDAAKSYTKTRADIGSEAHNAFELMIRGESLGTQPARIADHIRHFDQFLSAVQPELISAEDIAWDLDHGYAGSYDAILRIKVDPERKVIDPQGESVDVMADWKTGKSTYPDVALQMSAYAFAAERIDSDGNKGPIPDVNGAAVLHITEDTWSFKSVRIGEDTFEIFLGALGFFNIVQRWSVGRGSLDSTVLGKPLAKAPRRVQTGTERRR